MTVEKKVIQHAEVQSKPVLARNRAKRALDYIKSQGTIGDVSQSTISDLEVVIAILIMLGIEKSSLFGVVSEMADGQERLNDEAIAAGGDCYCLKCLLTGNTKH